LEGKRVVWKKMEKEGGTQEKEKANRKGDGSVKRRRGRRVRENMLLTSARKGQKGIRTGFFEEKPTSSGRTRKTRSGKKTQKGFLGPNDISEEPTLVC